MSVQKVCPHCGVVGELQKWGKDARRRTRYRCAACKKTSTGRTGTVRSGSHLTDRQWHTAVRLMSLRTCPSGADMGRLFARHPKTGQRLMRCLRSVLPESTAGPPLTGITELDETTMRHVWVGGGKSRRTGQIQLVLLMNRTARSMNRFVNGMLAPDATAFTDEWRGYNELRHTRKHFTVCHSREFVSHLHLTIHTNGIEGV